MNPFKQVNSFFYQQQPDQTNVVFIQAKLL